VVKCRENFFDINNFYSIHQGNVFGGICQGNVCGGVCNEIFVQMSFGF